MNTTAQDLVSQAKQEIPAISCTDFLTMQEQNIPHTLIDVRERDEWDAGHIEGATHIPRGLLEFKIQDVAPDKATPIIVHCASGGRSALCTQALIKMGYTNVKNLEGGYTAYQEMMKAKVF